MVTYMPIYTWVKGGKTSDCSPFKRRALCSTDKSLMKIISAALVQACGSRAELHATFSQSAMDL